MSATCVLEWKLVSFLLGTVLEGSHSKHRHFSTDALAGVDIPMPGLLGMAYQCLGRPCEPVFLSGPAGWLGPVGPDVVCREALIELANAYAECK